MKNDFQTMLDKAQSGDSEAIDRILTDFLPLINKYCYISNQPNEDLQSELYISAYMCILRFKIDHEDLEVFLGEAKKLGFLN